MIGWVHLNWSPEIYPVLCWYADRDGIEVVATKGGTTWFKSSVSAVDTEAEMVALLLQGYTLRIGRYRDEDDTRHWIRRLRIDGRRKGG